MTRFDPYRKRGLALIIIMSMVAAAVTAVALYVPYRAAFEQQQERLTETVRSWSRLIEAVARFDRIYSADNFPGGAMAATLHQIREAHGRFKGFGRTGEFTLAKRDGDQIAFLLNHRHYDLANPEPIPFSSRRAAPMRAALLGQSGNMVGEDYRGVNVLAAFEPVAELNFGVVVKIDLSEVREPFIYAALWATTVGLGLVLLGTLLFLRVGGPLMRSLVENELKYRAVFEQAPEGVLLVDALRGCVVEFNDKAHKDLGYTREEYARMQLVDINALDGPEQVRAQLQHITEQGTASYETQHQTKDGSRRDVMVNAQVIRLGLTPYVLAIISDITERKRMEEKLLMLATQDALTGLYNRGKIEHLVAEELGRTKRYKRQLTLFLIDIDHFKRINDTWGHPIGDLVLRRFAEILDTVIRECDRAGRYGGEEFLVMLPETGLEQAGQMAERLVSGLRTTPVEIGGGDSIHLTVSMGVASYPQHGNNRDQIISAADKAMYSAKHAGRDRLCLAQGDGGKSNIS